MQKASVSNSKNVGLSEGKKTSWLDFIIDCIPLSLEVLIRKNLGERYFTPLKFLFSLFLISGFFLFQFGILAGVASLVDGGNNTSSYPSSSPSYPSSSQSSSNYYERDRSYNSIFDEEEEQAQNISAVLWGIIFLALGAVFFVLMLAYFVLGCLEFYNNFMRNKKGVIWHTYFTGQSRFSFFEKIVKKARLPEFFGEHLVTRQISQLYVEPLVLFLISLILFIFHPIFSVWLFVSSIFIFIKGQRIYQRFKNQVLDIRDNQLENQNLAEVLGGNKTIDEAGLNPIAIRPDYSMGGVAVNDALLKALKKNPKLAKIQGLNFEDGEDKEG
jgi:ABC-type multidrug transport system fused ATPase/permease subunit